MDIKEMKLAESLIAVCLFIYFLILILFGILPYICIIFYNFLKLNSNQPFNKILSISHSYANKKSRLQFWDLSLRKLNIYTNYEKLYKHDATDYLCFKYTQSVYEN